MIERVRVPLLKQGISIAPTGLVFFFSMSGNNNYK
jgi:hypothetical protein